MEPKRILGLVFTLVTIVLLLVIGFNIAAHTNDADMSVMAQSVSVTQNP